jgi:hypothetical protein
VIRYLSLNIDPMNPSIAQPRHSRAADFMPAWLLNLMEAVRIRLRILFGRTLPQQEDGWHRLTEVFPRCQDARYDGMVEIFNWRTDYLSRGDYRCLCPHWEEYYWRTIRPDDAKDRGFQYFKASRTVFGRFGQSEATRGQLSLNA